MPRMSNRSAVLSSQSCSYLKAWQPDVIYHQISSVMSQRIIMVGKPYLLHHQNYSTSPNTVIIVVEVVGVRPRGTSRGAKMNGILLARTESSCRYNIKNSGHRRRQTYQFGSYLSWISAASRFPELQGHHAQGGRNPTGVLYQCCRYIDGDLAGLTHSARDKFTLLTCTCS